MKMNKRAVGVILLLILTFPTLSCVVTSRDINVEITCDDFAEHPTGTRNDFEMATGDKLRVVLCSNPSTGFAWSYSMSGDKAIKEEDHDYIEPDSSLPGASGKETWTFEAMNKGKTIIDMEYDQPWEGGTKQERTYRITVTVE
jgi:predicted secreted protein